MQNRNQSKLLWLCLFGILLLTLCFTLYYYYDSAISTTHVPLEPGNVRVPSKRSFVWQKRSEQTDTILNYWAGQPLGDWQKNGKVGAPRALMGRFALNRDLDSANIWQRQRRGESLAPPGRFILKVITILRLPDLSLFCFCLVTTPQFCIRTQEIIC